MRLRPAPKGGGMPRDGSLQMPTPHWKAHLAKAWKSSPSGVFTTENSQAALGSFYAWNSPTSALSSCTSYGVAVAKAVKIWPVHCRKRPSSGSTHLQEYGAPASDALLLSRRL
eukprot:gnl/TRDRNA2_/TRDRNA2_167760_c0_seq1.p1 gnl/TRDRNA2_/TRDRNA2_167760_c0~~gnl/TRDRNA2_/TRDRNA2_167760_c0_seq1.p1  ORF type:complete len:113 (+),score=7.60 gnl/TRDRNA2_/TRDRNA2_167760_c0_seq1:210-548(+)